MAVSHTISGPIATVTIDRSEAQNAFSSAMWQTMADICESIASDERVRVVVVAGVDEAFSVGGDFDEFASLTSRDERTAYLRTVVAAYAAYERLPMPTIAKVAGWALGGGCELAIVSDMVVAGASARFGLPEGRVGLYPGVAAARGRTSVPATTLDYLIYSGRIISAAEARDGGIVTLVVADDELDGAVEELAGDVAAQAPLAMRAAKRVARLAGAKGGYAQVTEEIPDLMDTADHRAGLDAFRERHMPSFEGR